jgi:putative ATP-binding cassette transporter
VQGTLYDQMRYPLSPHVGAEERERDIRAMRGALDTVGLPHLSSWDAVVDWTTVLSPGQLQLLSVGRMLFHAPRYVVMDEATSALDLRGEARVYDAVVAADVAVLSVGHRETLLRFHTSCLLLDGTGSWELRVRSD